MLSSIVYHIAAARIDKELFRRIIESFMLGIDYDEELKLDIARAIRL